MVLQPCPTVGSFSFVPIDGFKKGYFETSARMLDFQQLLGNKTNFKLLQFNSIKVDI